MERNNGRLGTKIREIDSHARKLLLNYPWPGNVRELENAVERAVVLCRGNTIELDDLPQALRGEGPCDKPVAEFSPDGVDFRETVAEYQEYLIRAALRRSGGVPRRAARKLKLSPPTLNEMIHRLGIEPAAKN